MKKEVVKGLLHASGRITTLVRCLDTEVEDCDEYSLESGEQEVLLESRNAARRALHHVIQAIEAMKVIDDEIAADLAAEELASLIGQLEDAPDREPEFDDPNT